MIEKFDKNQLAIIFLIIGLLIGGLSGFTAGNKMAEDTEETPVIFGENPTAEEGSQESSDTIEEPSTRLPDS